MYAASISYLAVEYSVVDVFNLTVTNYAGDELNGGLVSTWMDMTTFNTVGEKIVNGEFTTNSTYYDKVETFTTAAAAVAWNLIQLLSGLYIFNLIFFFGVPAPMVIGMAVLYMLLLSRTIIGYVRGV